MSSTFDSSCRDCIQYVFLPSFFEVIVLYYGLFVRADVNRNKKRNVSKDVRRQSFQGYNFSRGFEDYNLAFFFQDHSSTVVIKHQVKKLESVCLSHLRTAGYAAAMVENNSGPTCLHVLYPKNSANSQSQSQKIPESHRWKVAKFPIRRMGPILQDFDHPPDEKKMSRSQAKKHPADWSVLQDFSHCGCFFHSAGFYRIRRIQKNPPDFI